VKEGYISDTGGGISFYVGLDDAIKELVEIKRRLEAKGWKDLHLEAYDDYGSPTIRIYGQRPLTLAEIRQRQERKDHQRTRDLNELARLKALYEKKS